MCILTLTSCRQESQRGLSVLQDRIEKTSILCGKDIDNFLVIYKNEIEKRLFIIEKETPNNPIFQQVEEITVPDEEQIKTYLNMTISEIEKVTGNTINEEENVTVFLFEDSYQGLYLDNSSFYFFGKKDEMTEKPIGLTFYGKYHNSYLRMIGLSADMNFGDIMGLWGETEIEETEEENERRYRIKYERNGLLYSFASGNSEGDSFNTFVELL